MSRRWQSSNYQTIVLAVNGHSSRGRRETRTEPCLGRRRGGHTRHGRMRTAQREGVAVRSVAVRSVVGTHSDVSAHRTCVGAKLRSRSKPATRNTADNLRRDEKLGFRPPFGSERTGKHLAAVNLCCDSGSEHRCATQPARVVQTPRESSTRTGIETGPRVGPPTTRRGHG